MIAEGRAPVAPAEIHRNGVESVRITWSDGHESLFPNQYLRDNCPCATCRETRQGFALPVVEGEPPYPAQIRPIGRYALGFLWSDGHDSGIYSYDTLRSLCPCDRCTAAP